MVSVRFLQRRQREAQLVVNQAHHRQRCFDRNGIALNEEVDEEPAPLFMGEEKGEPARFTDLKFGADYNIADDVDEDDKKRSKRKLF